MHSAPAVAACARHDGDAGTTGATPRLAAWRERAGQRPAVRAVVGPMREFLASQGRPVPSFLPSHLAT